MRKLNAKDCCGFVVTVCLFALYGSMPACSGGQTGVATSLSSILPTPTPTATPIPTATPQSIPTPTPTPQAVPTPTPATTVPALFTVSASYPSPVYAPTHYSSNAAGNVAADWTQGCTMDVNQQNTSVRDIICTTEVAEGDAYATGFTFNAVAPLGSCAYIEQRPYWYYTATTGTGPTTVNATTNAAGAYTSVTSVPANEVTITPSGTLACIYDHSGAGGGNCCSGSYTLTVTPASGPAVTTNGISWNGSAGNCAAGAGSLSPFSRNAISGLPIPLLIPSFAGGTFPLAVAAPIASSNGTNLQVANYMTLTNANTPPAALTTTTLYYDWVCLDPAFAVLGRVRILLRKWNLESQLLLGPAGNPITSGNENGYPAPFLPYAGWDELISTNPTPFYPGNP